MNSGIGDGQGGLACCNSWGSKELDTTERLHFHFSLSCIGEGNGNPLQCSCLENPRDGGAWWTAVYGVTQSRTGLQRLSSSSSRGFPGGTVVKNLPANAGDQETWVQSLSQEDTLEYEMEPTPVFLPGKFHGQRSLEGYSPWGGKRVRQGLETKQQTT